MSRTEQLQIRVTPAEKAALKRLAQSAGQGVSAYVLSRALPKAKLRFEELVRALEEADGGERRFVLAELNDLLTGLARTELVDAVSDRPTLSSPYWQNYVAAMVEQAAHLKKVAPPAWLSEVEPLQEPHFVTPLEGLRLHLLRSSPVPFRRRNIFLDSGIGARV